MNSPSNTRSGDLGNQPVVLVFADSGAARRRGETAIAAAGWRLGGSLGLAEAIARIDLQAAIDAVLIELDGASNGVLDALLDRVERDAAAGAYRTIVSFPPAAIDVVTARITHPDITLLCDPDPLVRAAALGAALSRRGPWFSDERQDQQGGDEGGRDGVARLQHFGAEVGRIARALAALSADAIADADGMAAEASDEKGEGKVRDRAPGFSAEPGDLSGIPAETIRRTIRARRLRERFFDAASFADPAWDMLLDLMAARIEGRDVAVSSLCIAAAVPPTTALRWIRTMTEAGLFVRRADPTDGRRVYIELSGEAARGMASYFAAARGLGALAA